MREIRYFITALLLSVFFAVNVSASDNIVTIKPKFEGVKVSSDGSVELSFEKDYSSQSDGYSGYYDDYSDYYYDYDNPDSYELYRADTMDGEYTLVSSGSLSDSDNECYDKTAQSGKIYFYKICYTITTGKKTVYSEFSTPLEVSIVTTPSSIKNVRATAKKTFTVKWNKTANIDGYNIYIKEFDNKYLSYMHKYSKLVTSGIDNDDYEIPDEVKKIDYKLAGTVSSSAASFKYKKAKHGYGYLFAIRPYKITDGKKVESTTYYETHGVMDYYFCYNAENTKFNYKWPKNETQARKLCTTIKVRTWDFKNHSKHSGAKKSRVQYITVNKKYAATIKQIYKEIYNNKTKPPIYEAGSYRWRQNESTWSYHTVGTAIDMNCNENPMYKYTYTRSGKVKKKIIVGSFYKPKTNPYSMPRNGVIEKTFAKYGFVRLENDLMHYNAEWVCPSSNY